jgi:hypothetical protein
MGTNPKLFVGGALVVDPLVLLELHAASIKPAASTTRPVDHLLLCMVPSFC